MTPPYWQQAAQELAADEKIAEAVRAQRKAARKGKAA